MRELIDYVSAIEEVAVVLRQLERAGAHEAVAGFGGAARHAFYAAVAGSNRPTVIVTHSMQAAEAVVGDLAELLGENSVHLFPERELSHSDLLAFSPELSALRLQALSVLRTTKACVVVTTIRGMRQPLLSRESLERGLLTISKGDSVDLQETSERLVAMGYERALRVDARGQFAVRGGVLDVYPLVGEPLRIELFDVEIDSIRHFDAETQRSADHLSSVVVWPAKETVATTAELRAAADRVEKELQVQLDKISSEERRDQFREHVGRDIERMREGIHFPGLLRYVKILDEHAATLMEHVSKEAVVIYDEPTRLRETIERVSREEAEWLTGALEHGEVLPGLLMPMDPHEAFRASGRRQAFVSLFPRQVPGLSAMHTNTFSVRAMQNFHGQLPLLKSEVTRFQKSRQHIVFMASSDERAERLQRVLEDFSISVERRPQFSLEASQPMLLIGNLSGGFEWTSGHLTVVTEAEVFANRRRARKVRSDASEAARIKSYQDLQVGDYVVHVSHGIGRYMGLETLVIDGNHRDYLHLRYAREDKLYVPVDQINLVQKYLGSEDKIPRVHHLGGTDWARAKSKVSKSVRDIAAELIKLYAARETAPGHAFRTDTEWQRDFETNFPYEETIDQLRAVAEIKRDMERARPMDRLLCGDVGYGKTEVALRAASKAVFDGKQVALLVPTTILAQQHYETFRERFSGFPVTIEVLSRFRSKVDATRVVKGLETGAVDIVIGTHRLLQKNLKFKDLGLLVVDEEQRFGVTHKEKLKQLRHNIDCLTLTATPIPRTLHMSMVGVRDLSVIETPPENRFPVQTYVVEYNDALLREAIERELGRGGQVYVLYNQVKSIHSIAERVARLVPEARVAVGHGQMPEVELERVMLDFLQGESDVLVSTTIIETGLDIPNVNTLIVYHANRMGLSQLYQLRGRVGRSNRIAYAYFTYQPDKALSEVAEKRLQAIKEFTELGSGFKIAMRDLAIRGAGNLLGAEQHGFISSVGFDMYTEMLADAISELRGEKQEPVFEPAVEVTVDGYFSDEYIADPTQKIEMYKKVVACRTILEVNDLEEELLDRYGEWPQPVQNLLSVARIRAYAFTYGLASVIRQGSDIHVTTRQERYRSISGAHLFELTRLLPRRLPLKQLGETYQIVVEGRGLDDPQLLSLTERFLKGFGDVLNAQEELQNVN